MVHDVKTINGMKALVVPPVLCLRLTLDHYARQGVAKLCFPVNFMLALLLPLFVLVFRVLWLLRLRAAWL